MKALIGMTLTGIITAISCAAIFGAANKMQEEKLSNNLDSIDLYRKAYYKRNSKRKYDNKFFNDTVK